MFRHHIQMPPQLLTLLEAVSIPHIPTPFLPNATKGRNIHNNKKLQMAKRKATNRRRNKIARKSRRVNRGA